MKQTSINTKVNNVLFLSVGIIGAVVGIVFFFRVWDMRFNTIGQKQKQDAEIFASFIAQQIDEKVEDIEAYLLSPWWQDAIKEKNLSYANWEPNAINDYMVSMDQEWLSAEKDSQSMRDIFNSRMSKRLKLLAEKDSTIAEIFLTDKYGGLLASSDKTSDFYQADEEWWQRAYNNGKGDIFFGELELDDSSGKISSAVALPVKDETAQAIGVSKIVLDMPIFFQTLLKYTFGKTGHVAVLDKDGTILYHKGLESMSKSALLDLDIKRMLASKKGFEIIQENCLKSKGIVSISEIKSRYLQANGIHWVVVVSQELTEIFMPFYKVMFLVIVIVVLFSFLIVFFIRNILKFLLIVPVQKIQKGTEHFFKGELDYRIDIKTADEFGLLAKSLNEMSAHLKETMTSRDSLKEEIVERRKIEQALKESEKRFMDVLYASEDAILLIDGNTFVDCNEATARLLGYASREEFQKAHPSELSPLMQPDGKSSVEKADEMMKIAIERGFHKFEWIHKKLNGECFPVEVTLTPVTFQGKIVLHCLWRDITKQKEDEKKIKESKISLEKRTEDLSNALNEANKVRKIMASMLEDNNKAREALEKSMAEVKKNQNMLIQSEKLASIGQLAAGIAHEINNPVGFISGNISALDKYMADITRLLRLIETLKIAVKDGNLDQAQKIEKDVVELEKAIDIVFILNDIDNLLRESKEGVSRIKNIVQDLKTFSHSDEKARTTTDICRVIDSVLNIVINEIKYIADLKKEYSEGLFVSCNPQQIGQVFINILVNAAQAMKNRGVIAIKTYKKDNFVCIEISDTGSGISKENITKIFDAFFTTKEPGKGTGLGLGISAEIVKKHGGTIDVQSVLGQGTTFTISLPEVNALSGESNKKEV